MEIVFFCYRVAKYNCCVLHCLGGGMMMKRKGIHKPTIEDAIEISGIETLHPGGFELTRRTTEVTELKPGMRVLDAPSIP